MKRTSVQLTHRFIRLQSPVVNVQQLDSFYEANEPPKTKQEMDDIFRKITGRIETNVAKTAEEAHVNYNDE